MQKPKQILERNEIINGLFAYKPAVLKEYTDCWYIEYYVMHPVAKELTRKRQKVTSYKSKYGVREARNMLRVIVNRLNIRLEQGWSPFFEHEDGRLLETVPMVTEKFLNEKTKELRPASMRSYKSIVGKDFLTWVAKNYPTVTVLIFSVLQITYK